MDDQFEDRFYAWLDDPNAETAGDAFSYKADGYDIAKRAIAVADSHANCPRDTRPFTVIVGVAGPDRIETVHEVPPSSTLACVLGALQRDPDVVEVRLIGMLPEEPDEPGIQVTSENPDIAVTWTPDNVTDPDQPNQGEQPNV